MGTRRLHVATLILLAGCRPAAAHVESPSAASEPERAPEEDAPVEAEERTGAQDSETATAPEPVASAASELLPVGDARWTADPTLLTANLPHRLGITFRPCRASRVDAGGTAHNEMELHYDEQGRIVRAVTRVEGVPPDARFCFEDDVTRSHRRVGYGYRSDGRLSRVHVREELDSRFFYDTRARSRPRDRTRYSVVVRTEVPDSGGMGYTDMLRVEDGRARERITHWPPGDEESVTFTYDDSAHLVGRRTQRLDSSPDPGPEAFERSEQTLGYDAEGRLSSQSTTSRFVGDPNTTSGFRLTRDARGHLVRCTWDGDEDDVVEYERDARGRLTRRISRRGDAVRAEWRYEYECPPPAE